MTTEILAFRIGRRAIGVAALAGEAFAFSDGRHLSSRTDRALTSAEQYIRRLIDQLRPRVVALYAPTNTEGATRRIATSVFGSLQLCGTVVAVVDRAKLLAAFGRSPLKKQKELHALILDMWPDYGGLKGRVAPFIADAAATALYVESHVATVERS